MESEELSPTPAAPNPKRRCTPMEKAAIRMVVVSGAMTMAQVAQELGISENTIKSWSARENWLARPEAQNNAATRVVALSEKMTESLGEIRESSRIVAGRAARKGLQHLEAQDPGKIVEKAQALKNLVDASAKATGYDTDQTGNNLVLSIGFLDDDVRPVKARVVESPEP